METPDTLDSSDQTRFGSVTSDLSQAASILRAQAMRRGMVIEQCSAVDLAAAVIAADAWMMIAAATELYQAPEYGRVAGEVYMNILLRAAGCGGDNPNLGSRPDERDAAISAADGYRRWATALLGPEAPEALRRAAGDLCSAGDDTAFAAMGAVLAVAADAYYIETPQLEARELEFCEIAEGPVHSHANGAVDYDDSYGAAPLLEDLDQVVAQLEEFGGCADHGYAQPA